MHFNDVSISNSTIIMIYLLDWIHPLKTQVVGIIKNIIFINNGI